MIRLNTLLRDEGVDPARVKLVLHQDTRYRGRPTPYQLWLANDGSFDFYQKMQGRLIFGDAEFVASFVATPLDETLFVGLYQVKGGGVVPAGTIDPLSREDVTGLHLYDLESSEKLVDYRGRLTIDWGPGFRSWVQNAKNQDKAIIEIRRTAGEPPFPGFLDFRASLSALAAVPPVLAHRISFSQRHISFGKPKIGQAVRRPRPRCWGVLEPLGGVRGVWPRRQQTDAGRPRFRLPGFGPRGRVIFR